VTPPALSPSDMTPPFAVSVRARALAPSGIPFGPLAVARASALAADGGPPGQSLHVSLA